MSFGRLAEELSYEQRRTLLAVTLKGHESGWMLKLLQCPCLLVIGRPGSAKSSFAGALGIIREIAIAKLRQTVVVDPNAHLKVGKDIWRPSWEIRGARDDWDDIEDAISELYQRFAESKAANFVSSIYDELTVYEEKVDESKMSGFISQITSKARAAEEYITICSHNDTLKCLGGKPGQAKLKDDMVRLYLASESTETGKFKPTGKGVLEGLRFDEKNKPLDECVTIPRWLEPCILKTLFPERYRPELPNNRNSEQPSSESVTGSSAYSSNRFHFSSAGVPGTDAELPSGNGGTDRTIRALAVELVLRNLRNTWNRNSCRSRNHRFPR